MKKQAGFVALELVLIAIVIAVASYVGIKAYNERQAQQAVVSTEQNQPQSTVVPPTTAPTAPQVNQASDLNAAAAALDATNVDANTTDSSQLDTQLKGF